MFHKFDFMIWVTRFQSENGKLQIQKCVPHFSYWVVRSSCPTSLNNDFMQTNIHQIAERLRVIVVLCPSISIETDE